MPETFTPLSPAMFSRDGSLSLPSAPASGSAATSTIASASAPTETPAASGSANAPAAANCSGQPVVTLQRNGDVVTAIKVQCACGQVIELNCQY